MHDEGTSPLDRLTHHASRMKLALTVTGIILVGEVVGGYLSNSMALLSDAGHVATDFVAILLVWFTVRMARRPATPEMTYGYHRWSILAAVINALSLGGISIVIFYGAFQRWLNPEPVEGPLMLGVAVVGLLANLIVVRYLHSEAEESLAVKSAFWHALGDALSSVGVILASIAIIVTDWLWVDPAMSFIIGIVVLVGAWRLLREGLNVLLEAPPQHLSPQMIERDMAGMEGVNGVHDLHMWSIATGFNLLSCHLTLDDLPLSQGTRIMGNIREMLHAKYGIAHATLQLECPSCEVTCCPLCPLPQEGQNIPTKTIDNPKH